MNNTNNDKEIINEMCEVLKKTPGKHKTYEALRASLPESIRPSTHNKLWVLIQNNYLSLQEKGCGTTRGIIDGRPKGSPIAFYSEKHKSSEPSVQEAFIILKNAIEREMNNKSNEKIDHSIFSLEEAADHLMKLMPEDGSEIRASNLKAMMPEFWRMKNNWRKLTEKLKMLRRICQVGLKKNTKYHLPKRNTK